MQAITYNAKLRVIIWNCTNLQYNINSAVNQFKVCWQSVKRYVNFMAEKIIYRYISQKTF